MANTLVVQHSDADVIHWTATAGKSVGAIVTVGQLVGVCQITATTNAVIPVAVQGVWTLTKPTGTVFAQGAPVFVTATGTLNTTATGDTLVGHAWEAATSGAGLTTVKVGLKGFSANALTI